MSARCRIEGYAIVSADGMIADSDAIMPDILKSEADQRFFERELDHVDVVVHGRRSHEGQPNSARRRRVVLTRTIAAIAPDPDNPRSVLWNPAGATFDEACAALGLSQGVAAIIGGPQVYSLFLDVGYDRFHLSRSGKVELPGGLPVFLQGRLGRSPEDVLRQFGLVPEPERTLDGANRVTLVSWRRKASA
ncbi:MAG: dihydrofolate reductase [Roseiarcus sp.]|jgi:dihydrofolate reductase